MEHYGLRYIKIRISIYKYSLHQEWRESLYVSIQLIYNKTSVNKPKNKVSFIFNVKLMLANHKSFMTSHIIALHNKS